MQSRFALAAGLLTAVRVNQGVGQQLQSSERILDVGLKRDLPRHSFAEASDELVHACSNMGLKGGNQVEEREKERRSIERGDR